MKLWHESYTKKHIHYLMGRKPAKTTKVRLWPRPNLFVRALKRFMEAIG